ncbi:hypothetical protein ACF1D3_28345 [Streptomyces sp. NPDC014728]
MHGSAFACSGIDHLKRNRSVATRRDELAVRREATITVATITVAAVGE